MVVLFWAVMVGWVASYVYLYQVGTTASALLVGLFSAYVGAFGHNWVHQPKYRFWAYLSLDTVWLSSEGWVREHLLQHHMYTQTPWDNHLHGSDPFMPTNPTKERNFCEQYIFPYIHPLFLSFGPIGNWIAQTVEILNGHEEFQVGRLCLPIQVALIIQAWGWHGLWLTYAQGAILGVYYFTLAMMNHNDDRVTASVTARNRSGDWGQAQMHSSADWATHLNWWQALFHLYLNYHTVHHLFPRVDACHFSDIHQILLQTCKEFDVPYYDRDFFTVYKGIFKSLSTPQSFYEQIKVYGGGL